MSDDLGEIYRKLSRGYFFYLVRRPCTLEESLQEAPVDHLEHGCKYVLLQKGRDEKNPGVIRPQIYGNGPSIMLNGRPKTFSNLSVNSSTVTLDLDIMLDSHEFSQALRPVPAIN